MERIYRGRGRRSLDKGARRIWPDYTIHWETITAQARIDRILGAKLKKKRLRSYNLHIMIRNHLSRQLAFKHSITTVMITQLPKLTIPLSRSRPFSLPRTPLPKPKAWKHGRRRKYCQDNILPVESFRKGNAYGILLISWQIFDWIKRVRYGL